VGGIALLEGDEEMSKHPDILKCKCGATPTLRYKKPHIWIECKCGRMSELIADQSEKVDPTAVQAVIDNWNLIHGRKGDAVD